MSHIQHAILLVLLLWFVVIIHQPLLEKRKFKLKRDYKFHKRINDNFFGIIKSEGTFNQETDQVTSTNHFSWLLFMLTCVFNILDNKCLCCFS